VKPHIFVAGDGDQSAHDLYPTDVDFGYEEALIENAKGTVGALAFSDLDQDGWLELWMPNYDKSTMELFRLHSGVGEAIVAEDSPDFYEVDIEVDIDLGEAVEYAENFVDGFVEAFLQ